MGGFGVSPEGLRTVRNLLGLAADDVTSSRRTWDAGSRDAGRAFATVECGQAFVRFQQYVFDVLGARRDVLEGLALAAGDSAAGYESTDDAGAEQFGSSGWGLP